MSDSARLVRAAAVSPSSINREARTVDVIWSTGAAVRRRDLTGPYVEVLSLAASDVDLSQLIGASVLDAHRQDGVRSVLGVVLAASVDGQRGIATVQISARPDVEPVWNDIAAGILRHISVGYTVQSWRDDRDPTSGDRRRTAVRWTPTEVSFVPTPADPGATTRAEGGRTMTEAIITPPSGNPPPAPPVPDQSVQTRAAINTEIRGIARTAGLDQAWVDGQIDRAASSDDARAAAFQEMQRRSGGPLRTEQPRVQVLHDHDDPIQVRDAMAGAVAARWARQAPEGRAREFVNFSIVDMAADLMTRRGERVDARNRVAVVDLLFSRSGAHSTSDFPFLLEASANKMMLPKYVAAAPTYRRLAAQRRFADFKPHKFLQIGDFPELKKIGENGEVTYGTLSEKRETVEADQYGRGLIIGRKMLINDDLMQFAEFSTMAGTRVAADENRMFFAMLAENTGAGPTLSTDSKAVFHADHGNKAASGTAVDVTNYGAGVAALRKQTTLDGVKINAAPRYLAVGPDRELQARQLLTAVTPTKASDVNPWSGNAELLVDANIEGNRWYIFAEPEAVPVFVYGHLAGREGPQMRSEVQFDTQSLKVAVGLDFGFGAVDFRGGYFNAGG